MYGSPGSYGWLAVSRLVFSPVAPMAPQAWFCLMYGFHGSCGWLAVPGLVLAPVAPLALKAWR
eukprot:12417916-Karenia_brevis.AAC.1